MDVCRFLDVIYLTVNSNISMSITLLNIITIKTIELICQNTFKMKKEQNHHNILYGDCGSNTEFMNEVFVAVILSICLGRCGRC